MRIGLVELLTNDVVRLANFYKELLGVENGSDDPGYQVILEEGTTLAVWNDGSVKNNQNQNICLAFTVEDVEKEYLRVKAMGARIVQEPKLQPWGAVNMCLLDPDGNQVYLRSFPKE